MHGEFVRFFFRVFYKRFINILKVHIFCSHINIFSELFSALKLWISLRIGFQRGFFSTSMQIINSSGSSIKFAWTRWVFFQGSHKICTVYTLYTVNYTIYSTCHGRACDFFRFTVNFFFCLFFFSRCNWTVQFELYLNWNWNGIGLFQLWFRLECIDLIDSFNILYFFLQVFHLFILFYFNLFRILFSFFLSFFFLYRFFRCFFPCITNCMYQTR